MELQYCVHNGMAYIHVHTLQSVINIYYNLNDRRCSVRIKPLQTISHPSNRKPVILIQCSLILISARLRAIHLTVDFKHKW